METVTHIDELRSLFEESLRSPDQQCIRKTSTALIDDSDMSSNDCTDDDDNDDTELDNSNGSDPNESDLIQKLQSRLKISCCADCKAVTRITGISLCNKPGDAEYNDQPTVSLKKSSLQLQTPLQSPDVITETTICAPLSVNRIVRNSQTRCSILADDDDDVACQYGSAMSSADSGLSSNASLSTLSECSPNELKVHDDMFDSLMGETGYQAQRWPSLQQAVVICHSRQRSTSESSTLKSILRIKMTPNVFRSGRFVCRSISECEQSNQFDSVSSVMDSTNTLYDINENSNEFKKQVSFSERLVRQHLYRPNSSILGQKKKNQRKSAQKKLKDKAIRGKKQQNLNNMKNDVFDRERR